MKNKINEILKSGTIIQIKTRDSIEAYKHIVNSLGVCVIDNCKCHNISIDYLSNPNNLVFIGEDIHQATQNEMLIRYEEFKRNNKKIIILNNQNMSNVLDPYLEVFELGNPSKDEIKNFLIEKVEGEDDMMNDFSNKAVGLSLGEVERIIKSGTDIYEYKKNKLKSRGVEVIENKNELELSNLIGLDKVVNYSKCAINSGLGKGILVFGVPGSGKSQFAKSLGADLETPVINLNFGLMKGSYVGETEHKTKNILNSIDKMGKSIVLIDEIDKSLAGVSDGGNGTSKSQGGIFLNWMQEKNNDSYVIATANDISALPPEYLRAERWDAIFFVDVPSKSNQIKLYELYSSMYGVKGGFTPDSYTGAEIKSMCKTAKMLNVPTDEAKDYVKQLAKSNGKLREIKQWAELNCVCV